MYKILFSALLCLLLVGCFTSDDDIYGSGINVTITDAFSFENEKEYAVGDTIFFEFKFSRYLPEEGYTELLDIYETTASESFDYSFGLEKYSNFSEQFEHINIDRKYILGEESNGYGYFYSGYGTLAKLNDAKDAYESTVGLILAEEGTFRFNFENIYIANGYESSKIHLDLYHRFTEGNEIETEFIVVTD